ncbi:hypothetical protein CTI14_46995 [Methylobacterium radiotolerans]|nr:hypothetical protein CTI14_46995 [Methylobacterium radiotolerans]
MMTLALAGFTAFLLWNPRTGTNLRNVLGNNEAQGVASMIVPAMLLRAWKSKNARRTVQPVAPAALHRRRKDVPGLLFGLMIPCWSPP